MATTGIWNHAAAASISLAAAHPMASSAGSSASSNDGATISANDFLSLLVTEMQNQDPTASTDPNEYVNQLVNVNSLEQLIQINQTLSTAASSTTGTTPGIAGAAPIAAPATPSAESSTTSATPGIAGAASGAMRAMPQPGTHFTFDGASSADLHPGIAAPVEPIITNGNVAVPKINPAAHRIASALGPHPRRQ